MDLSLCSSSNLVPLNLNALGLMNQFCLCPEAKNLLSENLIQPLSLQVTDFPYAKTDFIYNKDLSKLKSAEITIPEKLSNEEALTRLTQEIFNCMNGKFQTLNNLAKAGDLSLDEYALGAEMEELSHQSKSDEVIFKCSGEWEIDPKKYRVVDDASKPRDLLSEAWIQDFHGHTDAFRATWLDRFQANYCEKHPEDKRSCTMKKADLIDLFVLNNLPLEDQAKILLKRICVQFHKAPKKVQDDYRSIFDRCSLKSSKSKKEL